MIVPLQRLAGLVALGAVFLVAGCAARPDTPAPSPDLAAVYEPQAGPSACALASAIHIGHLSPLGAYDDKAARVIVLDVDRQVPGPYWVDDTQLLEAMAASDPDDPSGNGLVKVAPPRLSGPGGPQR